MDRCELAFQYHQSGYNCAQSVLLAFSDLTGLDERTAASIAGGLGGGVGGSRAELCGAANGGALVLGLLYPFAEGTDGDARRRVYGLTKEFHTRFQNRFGGLTRCGDLLRSRIQPTEEGTPAAVRVGAGKHCDILVVTAVEILEQMIAEQADN